MFQNIQQRNKCFSMFSRNIYLCSAIPAWKSQTFTSKLPIQDEKLLKMNSKPFPSVSLLWFPVFQRFVSRTVIPSEPFSPHRIVIMVSIYKSQPNVIWAIGWITVRFVALSGIVKNNLIIWKKWGKRKTAKRDNSDNHSTWI